VCVAAVVAAAAAGFFSRISAACFGWRVASVLPPQQKCDVLVSFLSALIVYVYMCM
jgi:hypothetical protein